MKPSMEDICGAAAEGEAGADLSREGEGEGEGEGGSANNRDCTPERDQACPKAPVLIQRCCTGYIMSFPIKQLVPTDCIWITSFLPTSVW